MTGSKVSYSAGKEVAGEARRHVDGDEREDQPPGTIKEAGLVKDVVDPLVLDDSSEKAALRKPV